MSKLSAHTGFYATVKTGLNKNYNPVMEYKDYAERLKSLQIENGIKTQIELSRWLGFSRSIVSEWMRGECIPSMDTAIKLAEKFGCNAQWLLTGDGAKYKSDNTQTFINFIDVTHLNDEQRELISKMVKQFAGLEKTPKTENKPLTAEPEKGGGGGLIERKESLQTYSGKVPLQESIATTKRWQCKASREQEADGTYLCATERRAIERRVDETVQAKPSLNWAQLRSSFIDRLPQDNENNHQQQQSE